MTSEQMLISRGVDIQQLPISTDFSNNQLIITRTFKGKEANITALHDYYAYDLGWECQMQEGPVWTLTVVEPQTAYVYEYDIDYNTIEKDILQSDNALVASLGITEIRELESYLDQPEKYVPQVATTNGLILYSLLKNGVKSAIVEQQVVSRTYTIPYSGFIVSNKANNLKILSKNTLISQAELPDNYLDEIQPTGTFQSVTGYVRDATRPPALYGFLQRPAKIRQTIGQQVSVSQTWEYGLWSTDLYGNLI